LVSEARGDRRTARTYLERALALYSETDNLRATALLRVASAWLTLREGNPQIAEAEQLLVKALDDLHVVGSVLDVAYAETELARCHLLAGDWRASVILAQGVVDRLAETGPRIEAARARLLLADAQLAAGDIDAAVDSYTIRRPQPNCAPVERTGRRLQPGANLLKAWLVSVVQREALEAYRAASDAAGVAAPRPIARFADGAVRGRAVIPGQSSATSGATMERMVSQQRGPEVSLGERVRTQRVQRLLSQSELASRTELSGSYLSLIESGRRTPTPEVLQRIAEALECSPEYLQTGRGGASRF